MLKQLAAVIVIALVTMDLMGSADAQTGPGAPMQQPTGLATPPAVVSTGFLFAGAGDQALCVVGNVGVSSVTVTVESLDENGAVTGASGPAVLGPGLLFVGQANQLTFRCRFTVIGGSASDIRAQAEVRSLPIGGSQFTTNVISEAR